MSKLIQTLRAQWKIALPIGVAGVAVLAWLAFGLFGVQFLFIDDEVDEAGPIFASGAGASGLETDAISPQLADDMNAAAEELEMPLEVEVSEDMPEMEGAAAPEIVTLVSGDFQSRAHPTDGVAKVLNDGSEQRFLRFENFATDNGPDLNVYLTSADADADTGDFDDDFVDLGNLKGNIGDQNYEIPPDVDLDRYDTVVIWCVRFGVVFGAADLA